MSPSCEEFILRLNVCILSKEFSSMEVCLIFRLMESSQLETLEFWESRADRELLDRFLLRPLFLASILYSCWIFFWSLILLSWRWERSCVCSFLMLEMCELRRVTVSWIRRRQKCTPSSPNLKASMCLPTWLKIAQIWRLNLQLYLSKWIFLHNPSYSCLLTSLYPPLVAKLLPLPMPFFLLGLNALIELRVWVCR